MGNSKIPEATREAHEQVTALLDEVCRGTLSPDYAVLCRKGADALARKRPSPLLSGQAKSWACGIAYAVGRNNFLFAPDTVPHVSATELCRLFGVSPATGSAKAKAVEKSLKIRFMDPQWSLPSIVEQNPMTWMLQVNGVIMDIRTMPREVQELAWEKGLIPWIPADRQPPNPDQERVAEGAAGPPSPSPRAARSRSSEQPQNGKRRCGLCGKTGRLIRTECCNQLICDDEDQYVMFSYAHTSCSRNHRRYTLCGYHYYEEHIGDWRDCSECRKAFGGETYAYYGTNEYNFVRLETVPDYEPTHCTGCKRVVSLANDGYVMKSDGVYCMKCADVPGLSSKVRDKKGGM